MADLAALLDSAPNSSLRGCAAQLLAEIGTASAVAALLNALATAPRGEPPADILAALDSLVNPEAAPALAAFLLRTSEPEAVTRVRDALARLADAPGVLEIVTSLHEGAPERWQQVNLEGALLGVRSPAAIPILRQVLLRDANLTLRGQAALVLGYIGGPDAADALATALASSPSLALTAAVTESLALLQGRARKSSAQEYDPP